MRLPFRSAEFRSSLILLACGMLIIAGCGGERPTATKRIIILTNGDSPLWDAARAGMADAEVELKLNDSKLRAVLEVNDGTPQGQLDKLRQFASQSDIVAVGISAADADNAAVGDALRELQGKGVKIITVDSDVDREKFRDVRYGFVGTDNRAAGRELGICAKNIRPAGGDYVTFVGRTGAQNAIERIGGFGGGAGEKFQSLDSMGDENDLTRASNNVRNAIQNHPGKLTTLVGIWSYNAPAIADVVKELKKRDELTVVAFDAEPGAIARMGDGLIDALIVQNPYQMGYQGVRTLKALVENDTKTLAEIFPRQGQPDGDIYDTGLKVVVPDDKSPLKKEMFGNRTEYLKLPEFRDWLAKYKLDGS